MNANIRETPDFHVMKRSAPTIRDRLQQAGESARAHDLSPAAVAQIEGEAARLLAQGPAVAPSPAAVWRWQPALGYAMAVLIVGVLVWRVARPTANVDREVAQVAVGARHDPLQLERLVAEREERLREDLREFRRRHLADARRLHRSRAEELADTIAIRSGRLRAELN